MNGKPTILVVDDDSAVRVGLRLNLNRAGYTVIEAENGIDALENLKKTVPALIILDVEMPRMDGWQTLVTLRQMGMRCPVLMFTQLADVPSRVRGLDGGADDYIPKPCAPEELLARVRVLLRRAKAAMIDTERVLRLGDVVIDLDRRTATTVSGTLRLSRTDYTLLELLCATPGVPVSRDNIVERIWEGGAGSSHALDTHLWRLRKKLGDDAKVPKWIQNVPGYGYMLAKP